MIKNLHTARIIWLATSALALVAAIVGVATPTIYVGVMEPKLVPASIGQDLITICATLLLIVIAFTKLCNGVKGQIIAMGILGYFFYAYGLYVFEQVYNMWYLVYVAILALSFWGLIANSFWIDRYKIEHLELQNWVRITSIVVGLIQPVIFIPLWVASLLLLMQTGNRIENLFSVYIIDLVWIMPAFAMLSWLLIRRNRWGYVLMPALCIVGFVLIFSLAVSEWMKPGFGYEMDVKAVVMSLVLSGLFLITAIFGLTVQVQSST